MSKKELQKQIEELKRTIDFNKKDRKLEVEHIEERLDDFLGRKGKGSGFYLGSDGLASFNDKGDEGKFDKLLKYLGIEYFEEEGFRKIKKTK